MDSGLRAWLPSAMACPRCNTGSLSLKENSLVVVPSGDTKAIDDGAFHPTLYDGRFTCVAECSRPGCGDTSVVTGRAFCESEWDDDGESRALPA